MQFDDRLATVLRHRAGSERAARTQFRQLLDLLGSRDSTRDENLAAKAWLRLGALGEIIPAKDRAAMIADPGLRLRNPELTYHLAEDEPEVVAAALTHSRLSEQEWNALIPRLPIRARGFLRLRRDLPRSTTAVLDRLGIHDRGLPEPPGAATEEGTAPADMVIEAPAKAKAIPEPANDATAPLEDEHESEIGALVKRIESFRKARTAQPTEAEAPRLPLGDTASGSVSAPTGFAFTTDMEGRINWAQRHVAAQVIGTRLKGETMRRAVLLRQPIHSAAIELAGAKDVEGSWVVDAAPRFAPGDGRFTGYAGMFRRPPQNVGIQLDAQGAAEADRLRQLLHELRTPANAIQGFAEVIQQQVFGPAPHEYRALAANIASDGARILAGFEELDRLSKLETGALELEDGACDLNAIVDRQVGQLQDALRTRTSAFDYQSTPAGTIALSGTDCEALIWRLLATIAGTAGAGEELRVELSRAGPMARLCCELSTILAAEDDVFSATVQGSSGALSAGSFGPGFTLRLAQAEARAAGGNIARVDDWLLLTLPVLTASTAGHSQNPAA
ncbi:histidine kinase dimerization/phospho-acceptor domain-containing protein [Erythrobacter sp. HKB08]|uniref:histidine kinase dimerization/phospho-acceptor domain-containing protein n=1 Tax=Erythrobacter sp. HKB08 TaxID=2502843 RepID=UPI0010092DF7|nr:histidine kinase dimerization/phospho-acceptor domain-containing protein [Erythrobacter sp. HKB08]